MNTVTTPSTSEVTADDLAAAFGNFRGELFRPGQDGYDEHRLVWNRYFDPRPALIARRSGVADVIDAVNFARTTSRRLAVRGGGHSIAGRGTCDDGVVIDLRIMRHVHVDPDAQTAVVEGGATWGELDRESDVFGLATPGGALSMTGVAGVTLGGGFGWLVRRFGLCLDNVLSMNVVTADGQYVTCDAQRHPELFWALRGGGGNFGVVTSFRFRLHTINPSVLTGVLGWPIDDAADVLRFYDPLAPHLPREMGLNAQFVVAPPIPEIPEHLHGQPIFILIYAYHGEDHASGDAAIDQVRAFRRPAFDTTGVMSYVDLQRDNDIRVPASRSWWQSGYMDTLSPAVDEIVAQFKRAPSALCLSEFLTMSGAISDAAEDDTAFRRRDGWVYNVISMWADPAEDERHIDWARGYHHAMLPYASEGAYINFFSADEDDRVADAYGPEKLARLAQVKRTYDPTNLFSVNHNIRPAA